MSTTDFLTAVIKGDVAVVRAGLAAGMPVDGLDSNGFTPLINAAIFGQVEVARILLEAGANPGFRAHSPLFRRDKTTTALEQARGNAHQAVVDLLLQTGAAEMDPAQFAYDAVKSFAQAAEQASFKDVLRWLALLCGHPPRRWTRRKGVALFTLQRFEPLAERYAVEKVPPTDFAKTEMERRERLIELLQAEVRVAGYVLVLGDLLGHAAAAKLRLFPSGEKYAVLAATGTNGINYGYSTRDIIAWLLDLDKENPFDLTECWFDYVGGKFLQPLQNVQHWAEKMLQLCPDIDMSPQSLAEQLEATRRFGFWWD
jgi:hypothetical protein